MVLRFEKISPLLRSQDGIEFCGEVTHTHPGTVCLVAEQVELKSCSLDPVFLPFCLSALWPWLPNSELSMSLWAAAVVLYRTNEHLRGQK
jgi:hypothetical protein